MEVRDRIGASPLLVIPAKAGIHDDHVATCPRLRAILLRPAALR
jgi:hypothetical protein